MKNKKLICLFMTLLMLVMSVPALAAEEAPLVQPSAQADTNMSMNALEDAVVNVVVPTTGKMYINPLGFPINYEYDGETVRETNQIFSEPACIENKGDDPVRVSVALTTTIQGNQMTLASSSTKSSISTLKKAFVYFEMQAVSDPSSVTWDAAYDATKHVYISTAFTKSKKNIVELEDASKQNRYGAFRLTGDCIAEPKVPWNAADRMEVVIAYTFNPIITVS